jgi:calcineurin-like phosphoesterase family protein
MVTSASSAPVIVTRKEVERIFIKKDAESAIQEAAARNSPMEHAEAMAMTGAILRELQKAEAAQGTDRVMVTAQHGPASRLQSLIASGEAGELLLQPMPAGGLEAQFDTGDWLGWATVAWAKIKHLHKEPMRKPASTRPQPLAARGRIGIVGDWGTGLYGAPRIADAIRADRDPFLMLMHLGDTYYAGTKREIKDRFLDVWPMRREATHRALNSNHDMYSGGEHYFKDVLPAFDQNASYFAHQNEHWTLIGLDVAYKDHDIDDEQVDWVAQVLGQSANRKVVLFSHHQLFSGYDSQGAKLRAHPGFARILDSGRIFAWYWGHEHRCAIYQEPDASSGLLGRCIGHGGMPQGRAKTRNLPKAVGQDKADWRQAPARVEANGARIAPPFLVLEGRNPHIPGEEDDFTPHGYAVLTLDGPHLVEQVMDTEGQVVYERVLA